MPRNEKRQVVALTESPKGQLMLQSPVKGKFLVNPLPKGGGSAVDKLANKLAAITISNPSGGSRRRAVRPAAKAAAARRETDPTAAAIARAITSPHDSFPLRIHDAYANAPTAIGRPFAIQPISWNPVGTANPVNNDLPLTDTALFVFRDLLRAYIYYDQNLAQQNYVYIAKFSNKVGLLQTYSPAIGTETPLPMVLFTANTTYRPHGTTLYTGRSEGSNVKYVWLEALTAVTFTMALTETVAGYVTYVALQDGLPTAEVKVNFTASTTLTFNVATSAYYAFTMNASTAVNNIVTMTIASNGGVFCHNPMPGVNAVLASVQAARIYAASLMLTDEASDLTNQGKVVIYQASQGQEWQDYVSFSTAGSLFSAVASSNTSHVERLADGIYGYLKPTSSKDFDMESFIEVDVGDTVNDAWFNISPKHAFLVAYAQATASGAGDCYATFSYHVEYETDNVFIDAAPPTANARSLERGMELIAYLPQFSCNPLHLKEIWGAIKQGLKVGLNAYADWNPSIETIMKGISGAYKSSIPIARMLAAYL